jgi:hypothetical protein
VVAAKNDGFYSHLEGQWRLSAGFAFVGGLLEEERKHFLALEAHLDRHKAGSSKR